MNTLPHGEVFTPTDTVSGQFNTFDPDTGLLITLAGTPSIRIERLRSSTWSEVTGAGITLTVDANHSAAGARVGRHTVSIDLDDANISALAGDRYDIVLHAGTVDGDSMAHVVLGHFYVQADGLTTQQKADVNAEADTAVAPVLTQRSIPAKNSAFSFPFKMVDATDFVSPEPGLSVTATVSKDGAAFAAAAGTVTEIGNGWYEMPASAADMNAGRLIFRFTATGAAPTEIPITTDGGV